MLFRRQLQRTGEGEEEIQCHKKGGSGGCCQYKSSADIQGAKRERAEAEARDNDEAEIWEKEEKKRKAREPKTKAEA